MQRIGSSDLLLPTGDSQADTAAVDPRSADGAVTEDGWEVFHFEGGLQEYVQWLNRERDILHAPITVQRQVSAGRWGTSAVMCCLCAAALKGINETPGPSSCNKGANLEHAMRVQSTILGSDPGICPAIHPWMCC